VAEKFKPRAAGVVAEKLKHGTGGHHSHKFSTTRPPRHNGKNISKALLSKYLELISTAPLTSFPFSTAPLPKYVFPDFFISFSSLELISSTHKATKAACYTHGTTWLLQARLLYGTTAAQLNDSVAPQGTTTMRLLKAPRRCGSSRQWRRGLLHSAGSSKVWATPRRGLMATRLDDGCGSSWHHGGTTR
jgi:hypothetical protein